MQPRFFASECVQKQNKCSSVFVDTELALINLPKKVYSVIVTKNDAIIQIFQEIFVFESIFHNHIEQFIQASLNCFRRWRLKLKTKEFVILDLFMRGIKFALYKTSPISEYTFHEKI